MPDKECLEQRCKAWEKTLNRVFRLTAPIANCPDYDSDDSDTSTLAGEDTVDEAITVLPKKEEKKDRRFYIRRRKNVTVGMKMKKPLRIKANQHEFIT